MTQPSHPERLAGFEEARELLGSPLAAKLIAAALWRADGHGAEGPADAELRGDYERRADMVIDALDALLGQPADGDDTALGEVLGELL